MKRLIYSNRTEGTLLLEVLDFRFFIFLLGLDRPGIVILYKYSYYMDISNASIQIGTSIYRLEQSGCGQLNGNQFSSNKMVFP